MGVLTEESLTGYHSCHAEMIELLLVVFEVAFHELLLFVYLVSRLEDVLELLLSIVNSIDNSVVGWLLLPLHLDFLP